MGSIPSYGDPEWGGAGIALCELGVSVVDVVLEVRHAAVHPGLHGGVRNKGELLVH